MTSGKPIGQNKIHGEDALSLVGEQASCGNMEVRGGGMEASAQSEAQN